MYGPVAGSGEDDESFEGLFAGTSAANVVARMFSKSPCGAFRLIVIFPVASLVWMPLIEPLFALSDPTMPPKKPTPGESTLKSRTIDAVKSLAFTGVPSEYFRPLRRIIVYVLPPFVTFGRS